MESAAAEGRVRSIHTSSGGVPKHPVPEAVVGTLGIEGDRQRNLRHHGGPERALCLYSEEHLLALQAEGHPIRPGGMGENLLLAGLPWEALVPGSRIHFEGGVQLQVTSYAVPCATIAANFLEGGIQRVSQERHRGWSRLYTRVLEVGILRTGAPCHWIPPASGAC